MLVCLLFCVAEGAVIISRIMLKTNKLKNMISGTNEIFLFLNLGAR